MPAAVSFAAVVILSILPFSVRFGLPELCGPGSDVDTAAGVVCDDIPAQVYVSLYFRKERPVIQCRVFSRVFTNRERVVASHV